MIKKQKQVHPFFWFVFTCVLMFGFYAVTLHLESVDQAVEARQTKAHKPKKKPDPAPKPEVKPKKKKKEKAPKEPTRVVFGPEGEPEDYGTNARNSLNAIIIRELGHLRPSEGGIPF